MQVYLRLEKPPTYAPNEDRFITVPVAAIDTNPHPSLMLIMKALDAGTPAAQNIMIVKPDQLELYKRGNTFFAGWTMPIPLPPTPHILPPSCLIAEGYGKPTPFKAFFDMPSGYKAKLKVIGRDAFLTYISPSLNYAGPGTDGKVGTYIVWDVYAP
jgi:hypothetical protein